MKLLTTCTNVGRRLESREQSSNDWGMFLTERQKSSKNLTVTFGVVKGTNGINAAIMFHEGSQITAGGIGTTLIKLGYLLTARVKFFTKK